MWQLWQATQDKDWLRSTGWPVLKGVAIFWASRTTSTTVNSTQIYSLVNELGPDESHDHVTNSAYDLAVASLSLSHAIQAAAVLGVRGQIRANWSVIAAGLLESVPFDDAAGVIEEYEGSSTAKDKPNGLGVVVMRYPLNVTKQVYHMYISLRTPHAQRV
jgi:trehalose/maltose hydrolase-like predicted phosphorylase